MRPDQEIQMQLNPDAKMFKEWSDKLKRGQVKGYLWDGHHVLEVASEQISFTSTTGTVKMHHPLLDRYTRYAAVLQVGDNGKIKWFERDSNKFTDVITALDPAAGSVTLLGRGTVYPAKGWIDLRAGDVVEVHEEAGKLFLDSRHDDNIATLFTTGSALHEATHVSAQVEQSAVPVIEGGRLNVQVTDDYGLPATNATVSVAADSPNASAPDLVLQAAQNGTGTIPLTDHVKETVHFEITVQDNTYHDAMDMNQAVAVEKFTAGPPDHLTLNATTPPFIVGQSYQLTGVVYDIYNNTCEDDTILLARATAGSVDPQQQHTVNGAFHFQFNSPTRVQDVILTATSGNAESQVTVHLQPDQLSELKLMPESLEMTAGHINPVTIVAMDRYGNPIPNAHLKLNASGSASMQQEVTTDEEGHATVNVSDTKAETVIITATSSNQVSGSAQIVVRAGEPAHLTSQTDRLQFPADGQTVSTTTLYVTDEFGNPVPNKELTLRSESRAQFPNSVTTDDQGRAVFAVSDQTPETIVIQAVTENGVNCTVTLEAQRMFPPVTSANIITWDANVGPDGTIVVSGTVLDEHGQPCPDLSIPLLLGGGWVDMTPVSDANGNFTFVLHRTEGYDYASVSVLVADNQPKLIFAPPVSDWTDTGIDVEPGQILHIGGSSGLDIRIGGTVISTEGSAGGTFSTGSAGRLYLKGSNNVLVSNIVISLETECDHYKPLLQITADPATLKADGVSQATITGQAFEVTKDFMQHHILAPVVNGEVTLTVVNNNGILAQTTVVTDSNGRFQTTYTSGTIPGDVQVIASYRSGSASTLIKLQPPAIQATDIPEFQTILSNGKRLIYVDDVNGNDANNGLSPEKAVKTINHAVDLAGNGDGIFVKKGVYREKSPKQYWNSPRKYSALVVDKSVTIIGEDINETVLLVDDQNAWFVGSNNGHLLTFAASNAKVKNMTVKLSTTSTSRYLPVNVWGDTWEGWHQAKNCALENVLIEVHSYAQAIFYMNQSGANLYVHDVTIKTRNKLSTLVYTNAGNIIFDHDLIDVPYSNAYATGLYTNTGTIFNADPIIFRDYANDDLHLKPEYSGTYKAGAYYGTFYDDGTRYDIH